MDLQDYYSCKEERSTMTVPAELYRLMTVALFAAQGDGEESRMMLKRAMWVVWQLVIVFYPALDKYTLYDEG